MHTNNRAYTRVAANAGQHERHRGRETMMSISTVVYRFRSVCSFSASYLSGYSSTPQRSRPQCRCGRGLGAVGLIKPARQRNSSSWRRLCEAAGAARPRLAYA
jgi:hypothetical protein